MEDFNLVIKDLINKNTKEITVPEEIKHEFEKTADHYIQNGNFLDAMKVFALTKNKEKLIKTAELSLKENKPYDAFYGFYYADDVEQLNKVGFILLQIPDIETALKAFRKSNNQEMINFIVKNF